MFQDHKICSLNETHCSSELRTESFGCRVSCTGLYADLSYSEGNPQDETKDGAMILDPEVFSKLIRDYKIFKNNFAKNVKFDSTSPDLGMWNH